MRLTRFVATMVAALAAGALVTLAGLPLAAEAAPKAPALNVTCSLSGTTLVDFPPHSDFVLVHFYDDDLLIAQPLAAVKGGGHLKLQTPSNATRFDATATTRDGLVTDSGSCA